MNDASKAFFGLPVVQQFPFSTFIRVDGELQRYVVEAADHVAAIGAVEGVGWAVGTKLSPVLVLVEKQHIAMTMNNTRRD